MEHVFAFEHSYLIPLLPLVAAMIAGFFGAKWLKGQSHWPIWLGVGASAVLIGPVVGGAPISADGPQATAADTAVIKTPSAPRQERSAEDREWASGEFIEGSFLGRLMAACKGMAGARRGHLRKTATNETGSGCGAGGGQTQSAARVFAAARLDGARPGGEKGRP